MTRPQKGTIEYGAWNALNNALQVKVGEQVLIITDEKTFPLGQAFFKQAKALTGLQPLIHVLECYGRPLHCFPEKIAADVKKSTVTLYVATGQEGELAFRHPFIKAVMANNARHGHGIGLTEQIALTGLQADIPACDTRCAELYERLNGAQWARVQSKAGTDVTLEFAPYVPWDISNWSSMAQPGNWHNIPSGEVYTWPWRTNGVVVVDGVLGDHFDTKYGSLEKTPVTWRIKDNHVTSVSCSNKELERELSDYFYTSHNADIVGELGVGALELDGLVNSMLQDEKLLGTVHIAIGDNYGEKLGAPDYGQMTHCDGIILNASLMVGKYKKIDVILKDGVYQ